MVINIYRIRKPCSKSHSKNIIPWPDALLAKPNIKSVRTASSRSVSKSITRNNDIRNICTIMPKMLKHPWISLMRTNHHSSLLNILKCQRCKLIKLPNRPPMNSRPILPEILPLTITFHGNKPYLRAVSVQMMTNKTRLFGRPNNNSRRKLAE
ncbi:Uncharacterised protein [uncultured archaeon]|nr:Uncharacterised protein [uncultured archaeon]